ncbi:MAG: transketolase-like TK C-terminal-containing protein, partial [Actinomycetota bacterium]
LAALMKVPAIYVWTHDSVGLGEDGPTHEPIEHLASLRAIPNLVVIRPGDANETIEAWRTALALSEGRPVGDLPEQGGETPKGSDLADAHGSEGAETAEGPVALCLTRQNLPILDRTKVAPASGVAKGAYVLSDPDSGGSDLDLILIATGSEVSLAQEAAEELRSGGVKTRVVSMPSWELFERQPETYRDEVLPPAVTARVSIEAQCTFGWEKWIGQGGLAIGIDRFGASAPGGTIMKELGFTVENVVGKAKALFESTRKGV